MEPPSQPAGRFRVGPEPIEDQLARHRRVTLGLTAVAGGVGLMFLALFAAFRAPLIGLVVAGVLIGPIIAGAWLNHLRLRRALARGRPGGS